MWINIKIPTRYRVLVIEHFYVNNLTNTLRSSSIAVFQTPTSIDEHRKLSHSMGKQCCYLKHPSSDQMNGLQGRSYI